MQEVVLICGCPASGKSTVATAIKNSIYLNRDSVGGKLSALLPKMEKALNLGHSVVLDNTFPTIKDRKPFIDLCKENNVPIRCIHMTTSIEDAQINAINRMWDRYGQLFLGKDEFKNVKDPNIFPIVALFHYRKVHEKPTKAEGFTVVDEVEFVRNPITSTNKALILDYDQTLRDSTGKQAYPCHPDEIVILPGRKEKLAAYKAAGYILLGISNQSGVHKGNLDYETAVACFDRTNELLEHEIDYVFCPHQSNPPTCYCRKPQSGNLIKLILKYDLNPALCLMVGDQTSDKTCATRMGIPFQHADEFFK